MIKISIRGLRGGRAGVYQLAANAPAADPQMRCSSRRSEASNSSMVLDSMHTKPSCSACGLEKLRSPERDSSGTPCDPPLHDHVAACSSIVMSD